ncbi:hypothetical protein EAH76_03850 [Sphingomonas glacialis]|uniref:Lipoprotein n=2 Tax=Sphingomonas glacialis TaxID=658225 RepID=A0A502FW28_9SPHN|nr:hypothetical protein EAH76_03850 [Sphingomonas glacialis]
MINGMKVIFAIGQFGLLILSGCSFLEPRSTFQITSVDRSVKSASLKLCKQTFSLTHVDSRWQTTIHVPGDCDGGVATIMNDGRIVFCPIGYVTGGDGSNWQFTIKGDVCRPLVTYGDASSGNGS